MPSRRDQIRMSDEELRAFLAEQWIVSCATIGPQGRPHLVPLWYVADGIELRGWTYAKSQKARNLDRDPRTTLQVEDGVQYDELRGTMLECDVEVERDPERVAEYGLAALIVGGVAAVAAKKGLFSVLAGFLAVAWKFVAAAAIAAMAWLRRLFARKQA